MGDDPVEKYARLFNQGHFFEAHEVLEETWKQSSGADREILQGLIQVAAAMVHLQRGTRAGAEELLQKLPVRNLEKVESWRGIRTARLFHDVLACLKEASGWPRLDFLK